MIAACSCGRVELEASGAPIVSVVCYCDDCQAAARRIEALANAPPILDSHGGTAYVAYRKDRVHCSRGANLLQPHKLRENSATKRVVATCCNSLMFLGFDDSKHWTNVYRARVQGDAPPLQMRICTKFSPTAAELPRDLPNYPGYPFSFLIKLLGARIGMLFGS
jgi:hypothetical protein